MTEIERLWKEIRRLEKQVEALQRIERYTDAYDDLLQEPTARTTGANAPAFEQWLNNAGSRGVYAYSFTNAAAGSEKEIFFNIQIGHRVKVGSNLHIHVHWMAATTAANSKVRWGLEYAWKEPDAAYSTTETIIYADTDIYSNTGVTQYQHTITEFAELTPGATQDGLSAVLIGRLFRDSANGADTYTDKVALLYIDTHVEIDSLGSRSEYSK